MIKKTFTVALLLWACDSGHRVTLSNNDSVALSVRVRASDGSLDWQITLAPGSSASAAVHPETDMTLRTTVRENGVIVQERDKGYVSPSRVTQRTCIAVSRDRIDVSACD